MPVVDRSVTDQRTNQVSLTYRQEGNGNWPTSLKMVAKAPDGRSILVLGASGCAMAILLPSNAQAQQGQEPTLPPPPPPGKTPEGAELLQIYREYIKGDQERLDDLKKALAEWEKLPEPERPLERTLHKIERNFVKKGKELSGIDALVFPFIFAVASAIGLGIKVGELKNRNKAIAITTVSGIATAAIGSFTFINGAWDLTMGLLIIAAFYFLPAISLLVINSFGNKGGSQTGSTKVEPPSDDAN